MLVIHDMLKRSFLWTRERNIWRCRVRRKLRRRNRMPYAKKEIQAGEELEVRGERLAEFVDDVAILSLLPTLSGTAHRTERKRVFLEAERERSALST